VAELTLFKAHGLGNDYLLLEEGPPLSPADVVALCDRHIGLGGDGLLEPMATSRADAGFRIWNPDGSVAEKSGNGLRIASWWSHHVLGLPARHSVDTGFEVVTSAVDGDQVTIDMGRATFAPEAIPARVDGPLQVAGTTLTVVPVGTGNPHAVVFVDRSPDTYPWRVWGRGLEQHPAFPNRANVQVAQVLGPEQITLRIWERGAGETSASGSSSCAVAAAAVYTGRCPPGWITLTMPGGELLVRVGDDFALTLRGPVAPVARAQMIGWAHGR